MNEPQLTGLASSKQQWQTWKLLACCTA